MCASVHAFSFITAAPFDKVLSPWSIHTWMSHYVDSSSTEAVCSSGALAQVCIDLETDHFYVTICGKARWASQDAFCGEIEYDYIRLFDSINGNIQ